MVIKEGANIDEVNATLKLGGYKETALDMETKNRENRLIFWVLDDGVMITGYSTKTKKITSMSYMLSTGGFKAYRKTFYMDMVSYDTESRMLILKLKGSAEKDILTKPATKTPKPQ